MTFSMRSHPRSGQILALFLGLVAGTSCGGGGGMAMATLNPPSSQPIIASLALGGVAQGPVEVQGLGYYICVQGVFPSPSGSAPSSFFMGQITLFAGNFAPVGWLPCDGRLLNISTNAALFNLLGTTYGGDGATTFALPDLRARVPMGPK